MPFSSLSIHHWQPDRQRLVSSEVNADGSYGTDTLVQAKADGSLWQCERRTGNGQLLHSLMRVSQVTPSSFVIQYTDHILDGERLPDSPKYTVTRVPAMTEQTLRDLGDELDAAYMKRDLAALRRLLVDDYVSIDETGEVLNKDQDIEIVRSGDYLLKAAKEEEPAKVRILADTAVLHWTGTVTQEYKGKDTSGRFRTTTVWVKRDGRWQVLSWHASKLGGL